MPRIPINVPCPDRDSARPAIPPTIRVDDIKVKHEAPRGNTEAYIQIADTELKLKILAESIAKDFLPLDFTANDNIKIKSAEELSDTAYIYVDNGGVPVKIFAPAVLRTAIKWEDLADSTKEIIQHKLIAGNHIVIDSNNVISADVGVEAINGKTGDIQLTAADVNAYSKEEVYTKEEIDTAFNNLVIEVDGGRIEQ